MVLAVLPLVAVVAVVEAGAGVGTLQNGLDGWTSKGLTDPVCPSRRF
jgi:hypothetical protein